MVLGIIGVQFIFMNYIICSSFVVTNPPHYLIHQFTFFSVSVQPPAVFMVEQKG